MQVPISRQKTVGRRWPHNPRTPYQLTVRIINTLSTLGTAVINTRYSYLLFSAISLLPPTSFVML